MFSDSQTTINLIRRGTTKPKFKVITDCTRYLLAHRPGRVRIHKVKSHSGVVGNEFADVLAKQAIFDRPCISLPNDMMKGTHEALASSMLRDLIAECDRINEWEVLPRYLSDMQEGWNTSY
jgi:hypothetical protein